MTDDLPQIDKTYQLTVREVPKSVNTTGGVGERSNRYVAGREKKRWEGLYLVEMMVAKVEPFMQFCAVEVVVVFRHRHHRDIENYRHPIIKPLGDALQKGHYLKDDTDEWFAVKDVRFGPAPDPWPFSPLLKGYMDITLEARYA